MTEPFKVGDVITHEGFAPARTVTLEWVSDPDGAGSQFVAGQGSDRYPFAGVIYLPDWRIHVPEPERKRWVFETEKRKPEPGERYRATGLLGPANQIHVKVDGDCHNGEYDVIVSGSVKPLPEEQK